MCLDCIAHNVEFTEDCIVRPSLGLATEVTAQRERDCGNPR